MLAAHRDGVLDRAAVTDGDALLDVGTGDGLIGFAALDRVGLGGRVIFSDVSADLLAECRRRAAADGLLERCRFVQAGADDLCGVADGSVDVVTTRSVLIYVRRKQAAFAEFSRAATGWATVDLRADQQLRRCAGGLPPLRAGYDRGRRPATKVRRAYAAGPAGQDPMLNFDERDLL